MHHTLSNSRMRRMRRRFEKLYGKAAAEHCADRLAMMVGRYGLGLAEEMRSADWDQSDAILITYGDMISDEDGAPLQALRRFAEQHLAGAINTIHVLPFFPYSSDDGFSVIDYRAVNPACGRWEDIITLNNRFHLMFDLVLNHVSRKSIWFREFTSGVAPYRRYFIEMAPGIDLSAVVRPRTGDLLQKTQTRSGPKLVWTTFSPDQIDLNFANPDVLFEFLDILLLYISMGCRIVRLDAIAYLWKIPGTPCIHLEQTHEIVKLLREVVELVAPHALLLTETNVPHAENISYFGKGDESQMVYQFTLPPLLLHALVTGTARYLTSWASQLVPPPPGCTFLNFTASHDGIGVRPLEGILPPQELAAVMHAVKERGGFVSTKANRDGSQSPYELNITYFDALGDAGEEVSERHLERFLLSQALPLALQGIPAVYFNSLFGGRNHLGGVEYTGQARTINRRKWQRRELEQALADVSSPVSRVFRACTQMLRLRASIPAFHPNAAQEVLRLHDGVFAVARTSPDRKQVVVAVHNLTSKRIDAPTGEQAPLLAVEGPWIDLLRDRPKEGVPQRIRLNPYQVCWLQRPG